MNTTGKQSRKHIPSFASHHRQKDDIKSVGIYVVWLSPAGCGDFTGISKVAEMCPDFPPTILTAVHTSFNQNQNSLLVIPQIDNFSHQGL